MSDVREQLALSKKKLVQVLEDNEKAYWNNMKAWFKYRITKEEFDSEARKLLPKEKRHLHNEFLLSVLTKCHMHSSSGGSKESVQASLKVKKNKRLHAIKRKFDHRFAVNQSPSNSSSSLESKAKKMSFPVEEQPIRMCLKTLQIPSMEETRNFVSVISWEMGLDDATDEVVKLITEAVRVFLKNVLSAVFSRHSAYKVHNKVFKYSMGSECENPYLLIKSPPSVSRMKKSYKEKEQEKVERLGRDIQSSTAHRVPVNMYDLLLAIQVFRTTIIPSHTVYTLASERILSNLWHPDTSELKQDEVMLKIMG